MKQNNKIIDFFGNVIEDHQMAPTHISLYVSLFQVWSINQYQTPFRICRKNVMQLSKIRSFATYHKCINELQEAGFIIYSPSYNPYIGSSIEIIDFESESCRKNKIVSDKKKVSNKAVRFSVPLLYDVELYFNERNLLSEKAYQFYSFYQSKNWKLGKNQPMKCWKSAARSWISKMKITNQNQNS
jgi:hypothetical protein